MYRKNSGSTEQDKLQNRFTSFVTRTIANARIDYLRKESSRAHNTYDMSEEKFAMIPDKTDFTDQICNSDALSYALKQIDDRERYVLIARVLEEKSFEEIANKLGLKYKGVAAIYSRTVVKLRNILKGE